jgi:tetratricopeptide (TPR) repeat protein
MDDGEALGERGLELVRQIWAGGGDASALDQAIDLLSRSVAVLDGGTPNRAPYLIGLSAALGVRFDQGGDIADLDRAVEAGGAAIAALPEDSPLRAAYLDSLGSKLRKRFERAGNAADIDRAVSVSEEAVAALHEAGPETAGIFSNLGVALRERFEYTGSLADLSRAVEIGAETVARASADDPYRGGYLSNLGGALQQRFDQTGYLTDLDQAISVNQEAVAVTPPDSPYRVGFLSNLAGALHARFNRAGELADLDQAIAITEEAVASAPGGYAYRPAALSNLGNALQVRYRQLGSSADLDRAIGAVEEAVATLPDGHPDRPLYLSTLGQALQLRSGRTGRPADLERAIGISAEAVATTPAESPNSAGYLSGLGGVLMDRFARTGEVADLEAAIEFGDDALSATPSGHPLRPRYLSNLAARLGRRFERLGNAADLDRSIQLGEEAVAAAPADHPELAAYLIGLGSRLGDRFELSRRAEDIERGIEVGRAAARQAAARPEWRVGGSRVLGRLASLAGDWPLALDGYASAVRLGALLASRSLSWTDQEKRLRVMTGLGREAAAAALQAGQVDAAVELSELGRGVLLSQALDAHADLTGLAAAHPEVAADFTRLRDELDRPVAADEVSSSSDPARRSAADELARLADRIRSLPGFDRFLLAPRVTDLLAAATHGPLVSINVARLRADALILTTSGVDVLPLPEVVPAAVVEQVNKFLGAVADVENPDPALDPARREAAEQRLDEVLAWLWDAITGPVLDHLGLSGQPAEGAEWPRVWWCPSGPVAMFPLHAAGRHDTRFDERPQTVIDRAISSTTPTLRALLETGPRRAGSEADRLLVVAMPDTPGQPRLLGAEREADLLGELLAGRVDTLGLTTSSPATFATVTAALPGHRWAHFSCHGSSDVVEPSASRLLLADHQSQPLTVLDLTRARLDGAELAFLSACTTAYSGTSLPDEPIHLATACRVAGYRHVIATLWPIRDADAVRLTRRVYATMTADGGQLEAGRAAAALHFATRQLRLLYLSHPSRWAAYVHTGP